MTPQNPTYAASHIQTMAGKVTDQNLAVILGGRSTALLILMIVHEAGHVLDGYHRDWKEREHEPRHHHR